MKIPFRRRAFITGLVIAPVVLLGVYSLWHTVHYAGVPAPSKVAMQSLANPSEQAPPANYSVPADQPLSINLPSIKTTGFIQKVSVDAANQMVAPSNITMAGWYVGSVKPGDKGLSIIDGHLNGRRGNGVFYKLAELNEGDKFTVTYGNHSVRNFVVKRVTTVALADAGQILYNHDATIANQLNLITCGGEYNKSDKLYNKRVIVTAKAL